MGKGKTTSRVLVFDRKGKKLFPHDKINSHNSIYLESLIKIFTYTFIKINIVTNFIILLSK